MRVYEPPDVVPEADHEGWVWVLVLSGATAALCAWRLWWRRRW